MTPDSSPREIALRQHERRRELSFLRALQLEVPAAVADDVERCVLAIVEERDVMARALVEIDPARLRAAAGVLETALRAANDNFPKSELAKDLRRYASILDGGTTAEEQSS